MACTIFQTFDEKTTKSRFNQTSAKTKCSQVKKNTQNHRSIKQKEEKKRRKNGRHTENNKESQ